MLNLTTIRIILCFTILLILPLPVFASSTQQTFWYSEALESLKEMNILNDEEFFPNKKITRGEFASLIYSSLSEESNPENQKTFIDVQREDPYYTAITTLADLNIINGYEDRTFRPDQLLTRVQTAIIISKAFDIHSSQGDSLPFTDIDPNHWAYSSIHTLYHNDIVKGQTNIQYGPNEQLTWAQAIAMVYRTLQFKDYFADSSVSEEFQIAEIIPLSEDGQYLEITFNQSLDAIDKYQFNIYDASSLQKQGIQEVTLYKDGKKALIQMYPGAGLKTLTDYTVEFELSEKKISYNYYQNEFIQINDVKITNIDVKNRKVTFSKDNHTMELSVPESLKFDFVDAYNREARIWHNGDGELTLFELTNTPKDVKKKNKFIKRYKLNDFILVEQVDGSNVKGINGEIDLKDFDVLVKSHKMINIEDIQPGDLLVFNSKEKVLEVCTNIIEGNVETVYYEGIKIADKVYDYAGHYVDKNGKLETFDLDIGKDLENKKVKLFLTIDDDVILVTK